MATCKGRLLLLMVVLEIVVCVMADYRIGFSIIEYRNPSNMLYNDTCCINGCSGCRTTLRICFRDAQQSHTDVESECTRSRNRINANTVTFLAAGEPDIQQYYPRAFQIYVRVSHSLNEDTSEADFDPPFTDPLIDDIFIEANVNAVIFTDPVVNEIYTATGDFGRATLTIGVDVRCSPDYVGEACEMLCQPGDTNCRTVLTPDPPTITATPTLATITATPTLATTSPTPEVNTYTQLITPSTVPVMNSPMSPVPIAVGVSVALIILILIGIGVVIAIIIVVKKTRQDSWSPVKRRFHTHLTLERAERNLTADGIQRFSVISDNGEEVEYAMVNKTTTPPPPTPPPPYDSTKTQTIELESADEEIEEPTEELVSADEDGNQQFSGYETVDFDPSLEQRVRYASLNVHRNGTAPTQQSDNATENQGPPVQYTVVRHQDS